MGLETLHSACYILSAETSIPFYSTSNGYNNGEVAPKTLIKFTRNSETTGGIFVSSFAGFI